MKKSWRNLTLISIFMLIAVIFIASQLINVSAVNHPIKIKKDQIIKWNFEYLGNYTIDFSSLDWVEVIFTEINTNSITIDCTDSNNNTLITEYYPSETLKYLPLGNNDSYLIEPELTDIISHLAVISTNWKEHFEYWVSSTETLTITNRLGIHHLHYNFLGKNRDVYIFNGTVSQNHFYRDLIGEFKVIYETSSGILLDLFVNLNVGYTTEKLSFRLTYSDEESTTNLSFPSATILAIVGGSIFGSQGLVILTLFAAVFTKHRIETRQEKVIEEVVIEEIEEVVEDETPPPIKLAEDEYDFVTNCPFCNAELKPEDEVCPECGGKR